MTRSRPVWTQMRPTLPTVTALVLAGLTILLWRASGFRADTQGTLIDMGFDPGRAELLGALLIGACASAVIELALDMAGVAAFLGTCVVLTDDAGAFRHDTLATIRSIPDGGAFDPVGWILTGLAILAAAVIVAWAAATLARPVRAGTKRSITALIEMRTARRLTRSAVWPAGAAGILVALLVLGPVFGDLVNYGTDTRMSGAGAPQVGLFGGQGGSTPEPTATSSPTGSAGGSPTSSPGHTTTGSTVPASLVPGPIANTYVTPGVLSLAAPWSSSVPSGKARTYEATMPAFWTGGGFNAIDVYLPPGYNSSPSRHYPVVYEMPYNRNVWEKGMEVTSVLDSLITSGQLPPMIVVFVWGESPPYRDTECSDSKDGKEWFEKYIVGTVVPWVDQSLRTIKAAAARTTMGTSKGGYCAASVATHHPELFGSSISFSGYFTAGLVSSQTQGADLVFGRDPVYENSQSPILRLATIPKADRARMFFVDVADSSADIYGAQLNEFSAELTRTGTPQAFVPTPLGHGWAACKALLPAVLRLVVAHQVQLGVYG
jgi:enterochelin esterase-like enzyme